MIFCQLFCLLLLHEMITNLHDLLHLFYLSIFLPIDAENILSAHFFSGSPSHFRCSLDTHLIEGSQVFSSCSGRLNQCTSLLVILILEEFLFNSVMIMFSNALLLFSVVVGFVMSADIIFLWHTYHLHAHKALKVLIIFS